MGKRGSVAISKGDTDEYIKITPCPSLNGKILKKCPQFQESIIQLEVSRITKFKGGYGWIKIWDSGAVTQTIQHESSISAEPEHYQKVFQGFLDLVSKLDKTPSHGRRGSQRTND